MESIRKNKKLVSVVRYTLLQIKMGLRAAINEEIKAIFMSKSLFDIE
jgi:hypothetical protein